MSWQIIGPFDNSEREGFTKVYPPENKIDLSATYQGKEARSNGSLLSPKTNTARST